MIESIIAFLLSLFGKATEVVVSEVIKRKDDTYEDIKTADDFESSIWDDSDF